MGNKEQTLKGERKLREQGNNECGKKGIKELWGIKDQGNKGIREQGNEEIREKGCKGTCEQREHLTRGIME